MSLNPDKVQTSVPRPLPAAGVLAARNYMIIDMGTQMESYMGSDPKPSPKIAFIWELGTQLHQFDEKKGKEPLMIMQEYTMTSGDKAKLPAVLKTWGSMPKITKINVKPFLGQYCMLTIEHYIGKDGTQKARIANKGTAVAPFMKELPKPQAFNPNVILDLDNFDWATFYKIPKFLQDKIRKCTEFPGILARLPEPIGQGQAQGSYQQPTAAMPAVDNGPVMAQDSDAPAF